MILKLKTPISGMFINRYQNDILARPHKSTYTLCNISVREKWGKRFELAKTDEELEYASADGANLVFTAIAIGPFEAILYTSFWSFVGWKLWPRLKIRKE